MNRIIAPLVTKLTSEYIEGIDAKNFQLSVFSGSIELKNLQLKRSALAQLNLPVDVVRGTLSSLTIKIPWTNLSGQAVEVEVDELLLLAKPKSFGRSVLYVKLTPKALRTNEISLNTIGGVQLLDDKDEPLPLAEVRVGGSSKEKQKDYSHVLEDGQWKDSALWSGNSKECLIVKLTKPTCVKGFKLRTGANDVALDPVKWKAEGALALDARWSELADGKQSVNMPQERWSWSEPVRLKTSTGEDKEATLNEKRGFLDAHDEVIKAQSEGIAEQGSTFTERLQETIINNIQISINSIHVRFEDDVTNPNNVYALGICLESLQVYSTAANWERAFVTAVGDVVHKRAAIKNLGVYMDHAKILTHEMNMDRWQEFMQKGIAGRHNYVLSPLSLETNLAMLSSKGKNRQTDQPCVSAFVNSESLSLGINRSQVVSMLEVVQFLQKYTTLAKYHQARPIYPVSLAPASWWKFAKKCVIRTIREQRKATDVTYSGKKKIMEEYVTTFKSMQRVPWLSEVPEGSAAEVRYQRLLDVYDLYLPLDVLKSYRAEAQKELAAGRELYKTMEKKKAERQKEKKKKQGWSSWLTGAKVADTEEEAEEHEATVLQIDEEAREQLKNSIGWDDSEGESVPGSPHGKEMVKLFFQLNVSTISFVLSEKRASDFGSIVLCGLTMNLKQREEGMATQVMLKDFKVIDTSNNKDIVSVRQGTGDLLHIGYELAPDDGRADSALELTGRGLDVWFSSVWLSRVVSLVQIPPGINLSSLEASTTAALADFGSGATRGLLLAMEERKSIALDINIAGPRLWVPYSEDRVLEVNLGTLRVESDVDKMRKARVLESGSIKDEDYYDKFKFRLDGVLAALCKPCDAKTYSYLVSDVNFGLLFENCLTPDNEELASSRLSGEVESIGLFVSPKKLTDLLVATNVVTSWISNPSGMSENITDSAWTEEVRAQVPVYVNPSDASPLKHDESWHTYEATFIPQAYKLMLKRPDEPPMIFMIGRNTSIEADGEQLTVTLPQKRMAPGAFIRLKLQLSNVDELVHHINESKWALVQWTEMREVHQSKLKKDLDVKKEEVKEVTCMTKVNMFCDLKLRDVCLTLQDHERVITTIGMSELALRYTARPNDMSADLCVGRFSVTDILRSSEEKVFLGLHETGVDADSVSSRHAAHFTYHQASAGSPMEMTGKGIGISLSLACGKLFLDAERSTLSSLLGYLMSYTKVGSNERQTIIYEETTENRAKEPVAKKVRTDSTLVTLDMQEFATRFRSEDVIKFSTSATRSSIQVMIVPDDRMSVVAAMGNFQLTHHSDTHESYKQLVACGNEGSMLEVDYTQWYNEASATAPEYTARCVVRLGQCRIVYLQRIIAQLQRYFDVSYIMRDMPAAVQVADVCYSAASAAQEMAKAAAQTRAESLSLMQFDVEVAKPIVVIPYSATSSDYGEFIVGNLVFQTSLAEVQKGSWVEVLDIKLENTALVLHDNRMAHSGCHKSIVEDWSISLLGERKVVDPSESLPSMRMNSKIGDIKITLTKAQYEAIMSILNTNVLDTWLDQEMPIVSTESVPVGETKTAEPNEVAESQRQGSFVFDLEFNKLTLVLEVDKEGNELVPPKGLLHSHMQGLKVSHVGTSDGGMTTSIWLGNIGVTDKRESASQYASRFFAFGNTDDVNSDHKVDELFKRTASATEEKMAVHLPAATLTVLPDLIGDTMKFFVGEHSSIEATERHEALKATIVEAEAGGDHFVTHGAWSELDSDLFLGPSHRLIAKASNAEGGRVVVDGCGKYSVYLTGELSCNDAIQPPFDVQQSCIVVARDTTLIFRNTKVYCLSVLEDYILPGSGKVLVDPATSTLVSKKLQALARKAPRPPKLWEFKAAMSRGFTVHLPENTARRTSRMLVLGIEGSLDMVNEPDGSSYVGFHASNFAIFPSTLCGDNSKLQFHNVIGPTEIQVRMQTHVGEDVTEMNIMVEGQNCDMRISYKDVKVVLRAWSSLSNALWGETTKTGDIAIYAPQDISSSQAVVAEPIKQRSVGKIRMNLDKCSLLIVDHQKGYDRELLRVVFDKGDGLYALSYKMDTKTESTGDSTVTGELDINMSIDYHNHSNAFWEPILEPYSCSIGLVQEPTPSATVPSATTINVMGSGDMGLNVSNEVITYLLHVSNDWQTGLAELSLTEADGAHAHTQHQYVLENQLGLSLDVKGPFIPDSVGDDDDDDDVAIPNQSIVLKGESYVYNANDEEGVDLNIDFGTCGLRPLKIMESEMFQQFVVPKTKLDQNERMVYATTRRRVGQLVTELTSRYIVFNRTCLPLELRVQNTVIPIPAYNGENDGSSEVGIPLWALSDKHCGIEIRSAAKEHEGHHWSVTASRDDAKLPIASSQPAHGSFTCGYVGQDTKDPLTFYFNKIVRETPCIKKGSELRVIEIKAPVMLENLLPVPMEIMLSHGESMQDCRAKISLEAGESQEVFGVSDDTIFATYNVMTPASGQAFPVTKPVLIHSDALKKNTENPCVNLQDNETRRICHCILVNKCEDTNRAVREVSLYAPYWVVNLTKQDTLFIREREGRPISNGLVKEDGPGGPPPLIYSGVLDDAFGGKISVGVSPSGMSEPFTYDTVGVPGEARCYDENHELRFGVAIELAPGKFMRTKIVKLTQRWVFTNKTSLPLSLKRPLKGYDTPMVLLAGESSEDLLFPAKYQNGEDEEMILSIFGNTTWGESKVFKFSDLGTQYLTLHHVAQGLKTLDCRVVQLGSINYVILSESTSPPLRVVNNTFHSVMVGDDKEGQPEVDVSSFAICPYYPERTKEVKVPRIRVRSGNLLDTHVELAMGPQEQKGHASDIIAHIELGHDSMLLVLEHESMRREDTSDLQIPLFKLNFQSTITLSLIKGAGPERHEIAYVYLGGVMFYLAQKTDAMDMKVSVEVLQVDNQMHNAIFPVLLTSTTVSDRMKTVKQKVETNKTGHNDPNADDKKREALHFSVIDYSTRIGGMTTMTHCGLLLQELHVSVDDSFLMELLGYLGSVFVAETTTTYEIQKALQWLPEYSEELHGASNSGKFYAGELMLNPMKFVITFQAEQKMKSGKAEDLLHSAVSTLTMAVTNIEEGILKLDALIMNPATGSMADITAAVTQHYKTCGIKAAYRLVGALDFIGNPVGLIDNLGDGISDMFYEPVHGIKQSPGQFAVGIGRGLGSMGRHSAYGLLGTVGGISTSISKGVAQLSMDETYIKERRKRQRQKAVTVAQGLEQGGMAFGRGVFDGITGLVMKPIEGFKNHEGNKVVGLSLGIGRGLIGVPVKVVSGVLDAVGKAAEGTKGHVAGADIALRRRPPRAMIGGVIQPYCRLHACAHDMIRSLGLADNIALLIPYYCSKDKMVQTAFTNHHIVLFDVENDGTKWTCNLVLDYKKITEVTVKDAARVTLKVPGTREVEIRMVRSKRYVYEVIELLGKILPRVPLHQWVFPDLVGSSTGYVETWENERCYRSAFSKTLLPSDRAAWSDEQGKEERLKTDMKYLPPNCVWLSDWQPVMKKDKTDEDGWMYAQDFVFNWSNECSAADTVRRRQWVRKFGLFEDEQVRLTMSLNPESEALEMFSEKQLEVAKTEMKTYETYENQRSYPFVGFSTKLLPTDRSQWSSRNGKKKLKKDTFYLDEGWKWLGDWQIDRSSKTDTDGWEYAVDFPFEFHSSKSTQHLVRRRRWTRRAVCSGIN